MSCEFVSLVYSIEEISKAAHGKGENPRSSKRFKDIKSDLEAAQERIRRSNELHKKMEAEYQAMIAAMQKRIEEVQGTKKQRSQVCFHTFFQILWTPAVTARKGLNFTYVPHTDMNFISCREY